MVNFDDMTLEELQQLLNVNTKNPNEVKRIQAISGLTGKAVDGIWGKQTSKAFNNFLNKNQSYIEQAIQDEQKFQNAMANGQKSPAVEDIIGYSEQLDEQNSYINEKISQLEQQIAQVKERIARNKRTLSGKSYEDVNNQIAALEMKKINSQDPSMIWRWQQQRQDTNTANANVKSNEAAKFANTVDMWVNTRPAPTTEGIQQQISNINSAIRDGKNAGADVSRLVTKKEELESLVYVDDSQSDTGSKYGKGTDIEKLNADVEDIISAAKTSTEIAQYIEKNKKFLNPEQINKLNDKQRELENKEIEKAKSEKFEKWLKEHGHKYGSEGMSSKILATRKRQYGG